MAIEEGQITLHSVSENTITKLVDYDVEDALKILSSRHRKTSGDMESTLKSFTQKLFR